MTETPCTMLGGHLDGDLRVVEDNVLTLSRPVPREQLADQNRPQWAGYERTSQNEFEFIGLAVSFGVGLFLGTKGSQ